MVDGEPERKRWKFVKVAEPACRSGTWEMAEKKTTSQLLVGAANSISKSKAMVWLCYIFSFFLPSFLPFLPSFLPSYIRRRCGSYDNPWHTLLFRIFFGKPYLMDGQRKTTIRVCVRVYTRSEVDLLSPDPRDCLDFLRALRGRIQLPHNATTRRDRPRNSSGVSKLYIALEFFIPTQGRQLESRRDSYCRVRFIALWVARCRWRSRSRDDSVSRVIQSYLSVGRYIQGRVFVA